MAWITRVAAGTVAATALVIGLAGPAQAATHKTHRASAQKELTRRVALCRAAVAGSVKQNRDLTTHAWTLRCVLNGGGGYDADDSTHKLLIDSSGMKNAKVAKRQVALAVADVTQSHRLTWKREDASKKAAARQAVLDEQAHVAAADQRVADNVAACTQAVAIRPGWAQNAIDAGVVITCEDKGETSWDGVAYKNTIVLNTHAVLPLSGWLGVLSHEAGHTFDSLTLKSETRIWLMRQLGEVNPTAQTWWRGEVNIDAGEQVGGVAYYASFVEAWAETSRTCQGFPRRNDPYAIFSCTLWGRAPGP